MAISVRELITNNEKSFQLRLIAGAGALDYKCTWVHMIEDSNVSSFFWGNELVVTSGLLMPEDDVFIENLRALIKKDCAGVVVNIGPYISEISRPVIEFCDENNLPLLTMPWNRSMTEFTRACCTQIIRANLDDEKLAESILQVILSPHEHPQEIESIRDSFDESSGFTFISMGINLHEEHNKYNQENMLLMGTALRGYNFQYLVFRHERFFLAFLNQTDPAIAMDAAERMYKAVKGAFPDSVVHIGVGDPVTDIFKLDYAFQSAKAARRNSTLRNESISLFSSIGMFRLFYTVSDTSILESYYNDVLGPLKGSASLTETLFRYILADGSIKEVAAKMYVHENTILYRMNKIRTMTGCSLQTVPERQPYLMAYYCGLILGNIAELE